MGATDSDGDKHSQPSDGEAEEDVVGNEVYLENQLLSSIADKYLVSHVTELHMSGNIVTSLDGMFAKMKQLRVLVFDNNQISTVSPSTLAHLRNLTVLCGNENQITSLPPDIGKLDSLRDLYLSHNGLISVPKSLFSLPNLVNLSLSFNSLHRLPEIRGLSRLEQLFLHNNELSSLPDTIGKLSSLQYLSLDNNKLSYLPLQIGDMASLTQLFVANNILRELPSEIGKLEHLEKASFQNNKIKHIPSSIGELVNLETLHLGRNDLVTLPNEMGALSKAMDMDLRENPFQHSIQQAYGQGRRALLGFLTVRGLARQGSDIAQNDIQRLITFSQSHVEEIKVVAKEAIISLALDTATQEALVDAGGLDVLLEMTHSHLHVEDQLYGACALSFLSFLPYAQLKIVEEEILQPLLALSLSDKLEVQRYVLRAIGNVCGNPKLKAKVIEEEGVAALVALTFHDNLEIKCEAARALANLASSPESRTHIVGEGGLDPLIALAYCNDPLLQCEIALADKRVATHTNIAEMSNEPLQLEPVFHTMHSQVRHIYVRNMGTLISVARSSLLFSLLWVQYESIRALANLAVDRNIQQLMVFAGALELITTLIVSTNEDVTYETVRAVAHLSVGCAGEILETIGVSRIVSLIESAETRTKLEALRALCHLSGHNSFTMDSIHGEELEAVIVALSDVTEEARVLAAKTLFTLAAKANGFRTVISERGGHNLLAASVQARLVDGVDEIDESEITIGEELGEGLYSVFDGSYNSKLAVFKRVDPNEWHFNEDLFRRQVALMSLIPDHQNIVSFFGLFKQREPFLYVVTEKVAPVVTLRDAVRGRQVDIGWILTIAQQIVTGILHLHSLGLVHANLKSTNLLIGPGDVVKLGDYCLTNFVDMRSFWNSRGGFQYCAPDFLKEPSRATQAGDIYSFGVILWEMVSGEEPYKEIVKSSQGRHDKFLTAITSAPFSPAKRPNIPERCPPMLASLIKECWHSDPECRPAPQSLSAIIEGLENDLVSSTHNVDSTRTGR